MLKNMESAERVPDPRDDPPAISRSRAFTMGALTVAVGLAGTAVAASLDRLDTALLFVGVPCLMALAAGLLPARTSWGQVFQVVTVALLLGSALLHEGALCVLLAAPLVYGAAGAGYGLVRLVRGDRGHRAVLLPGLALVALSLEGVAPGLRVSPEQDATATRTVEASCATFEQALARGPRFAPEDRGLLLRLAKYPTPSTGASTSSSADGLTVGDTWELQMPDGVISTRVTEATHGRMAFTVLGDTARTTRWVTLHGGTLTWQASERGCRTHLVIDYRRHLDPAFWFGPITETFMNAGADTLLAGLD